MKLDFTKMHGLGNDFVVIDNMQKGYKLTAEMIRYMADRRTGIGFDQLLEVLPSENGGDIRFVFYNADGGTARQCGNGIRCLAKYVLDRGILDKPEILADTVSGKVKILLEDSGNVRANMGMPSFEPADIPLDYPARQPTYEIETESGKEEVFSLSMGNPHAVLLVDDVNTAAVENLGPQIQSSHRYPDSVNVGFMQLVDRNHVKLRVYERGVGETLACGTGACAAVVAGIESGMLGNEVEVAVARGSLAVEWHGVGTEVWLSGPATRVFDGQIEL